MPTVSSAPQGVTVLEGETAAFSVSATGVGALSYQWRKNGTDIAGATSTTYATAPVTLQDDGAQILVVVSNATGSVPSPAVLLSVQPAAPNLTQPLANVSVVAGQEATFSVAAAGRGPFSYQWRRAGAAIAGATQSGYTIAATTTADDGAAISVTVTGSAGAVTSAAATLSVTAVAVAPSIVVQPQAQTAAFGQTATFSVTASGTTALTYQWQRNGVDIAGATSPSFTTAPLALADNASAFRVIVNNPTGVAVASAAATLTVLAAGPTITTQPTGAAAQVGRSATFRISATGTAPLAIQWQRDGVDIANQTGASYTIAFASLADHRARFRAVVRDARGIVVSDEVALRVTPITLSGVRAGGGYSSGLNADGSVWEWGRHPANETAVLSNAPKLVHSAAGPLFDGLVGLSSGESHQLGVRADGSVWAWGDNNNGVLGIGATTGFERRPVRVRNADGTPFMNGVQVAAGLSYSLALRQDGTVWAWGNNGNGSLGIGSNGGVLANPQQVLETGGAALAGVASIYANALSEYSMALKNDGTVWAWGRKLNGGLGGDGTVIASNVAIQVNHGAMALTGVRSLAVGLYHSVALMNDGTVLSWGTNDSGQLGDGSNTFAGLPVALRDAGGALFGGVATVAAGEDFTLLLRSDGTVWSLGNNSAGRLGDSTERNRVFPVQVVDTANQPLIGVKEIAAGRWHSVVLKQDGTAWTWGRNADCQVLSSCGTSFSGNAGFVGGLVP